VIIDAGSELLLFRSVEGAESYLEPIDVDSGEYAAAYDGRGRHLALAVEARPTTNRFGPWSGGGTGVTLRLPAREVDGSLELATKLRAFLERLGEPPPAGNIPLDALLEQVGKRVGFAG
jgi:hypothetical protein